MKELNEIIPLEKNERFELEYLRDEKETQTKVFTSFFWLVVTLIELKVFDAIMFWAFLGTLQIPDVQWKIIITLMLYTGGIWIGVVTIGLHGWERACYPFYDDVQIVREKIDAIIKGAKKGLVDSDDL